MLITENQNTIHIKHKHKIYRIEIAAQVVVETKQKLADYFQFNGNTQNGLPYKINTLTSKKYANTNRGLHSESHYQLISENGNIHNVEKKKGADDKHGSWLRVDKRCTEHYNVINIDNL